MWMHGPDAFGGWGRQLGEQDVMLTGRKQVRRDLGCVKTQYNLVNQHSLSLFSFLDFSTLLSTCLRLGIKDTVLVEG